MLDIRTMLVLLALSVFFLSLAMLAASRAYPEPMRLATWVWSLGNFAQVTALLLLSLRGHIPDLISIVVADTVLLFSVAVLYRALAIFTGRPPRERLMSLLVALTAPGVFYLTYLQPSSADRTVLINTMTALLAFMCALLLFRADDVGALGRWIVLVNALALAAALGARVLYLLIAHPHDTDLFNQSTGDVVYWLVLYLGAVFRMYGWVLMCGDRFNEENLRLAAYDALTGIFNRRSVEDLARRVFAAARRAPAPLSVLLVDLDHFKAINDTHGHAEGDKALRAFARVAGAALRTGDVLGRFGGEEFLVVLPGAAGAEALDAAERLRALVARDVRVGAGSGRPLTISIGVAEALPEDLDVEAVIRRADTALYEAKAHGRNRVVARGDLARAASG